MKKQLCILLLSILFFGLNSMAKVITVNNRLDLAVADFPSLQTAYDNASAGDTLLVYPSETTYAGIDISKKVILIGSGFTSTANMPATKISGTVNFLAGSDGSVIESFGDDFTITVTSANSITISKNSFKNIIIDNSFSTLLLGNAMYGKSYTNLTSIVIIKGNSLVEAISNIISGSSNYNNQFNISRAITIESASAINIANCIVVCGTALQGGTVNSRNSLIYGWVYECNLSLNYSITRGIDNYTDFFNFFVGFNTSNFHLASGSPASGTGENGTDMGIYDGDTPFVDGGYPSIPIIYQLDVPLIGSQRDGINVTIKAKSNN